MPWSYFNYSMYLGEGKKLFEKGFPAHPYIQAARTEVINESCFSYPQIVKNEIEYLHSKICQFNNAKAENSESTDEEKNNVFVRDFQIGNISYDYKKLLTSRNIINKNPTKA